MIRRTLLALLALALAVGATACGGDDDASSDTGDEATGTDGGQPSDEAPAEGDEAGADDMTTQVGGEPEFTGEGSEPFCAEVGALRDSGADDPAVTDDAAFAQQMAAIEPPAEIAAEWTNLYTVQQEVAATGEGMDAMSPEELDQWSRAGAVVATYLSDVCGLEDTGG
jgi:hypothetical protein